MNTLKIRCNLASNYYNYTVNSDTFSAGDTINLTIQGVNTFFIETLPYISFFDTDINEQKVYLNKIDDENYSINYTFPSNMYDDKAVISIYFNLEKYVTITQDISFCTLNIEPSEKIKANETVTFTITANSDYYFTNAPYINILTGAGDYYKYYFNTDETGNYKTSYHYSTIFDGDEQTIEIFANGQVIPKIDKYGIIKMYNPTPQEMKLIGDVRYYTLKGEILDLGAFISNIIKVFINIPQGNKADVMLGGYSTNVNCNVCLDDIIETDCGSIDIIGKYNNIMDYDNTSIEIYLPFVGFKPLETAKVMNNKLHLIYKTNIINGDSLACIFDSDNVLIYTFDCNLSFRIPYNLLGYYSNNTPLEITNNYLFGFTPYVIIRTNKSYNTGNIIANDNRVAKIKDLHNYIECSKVFNTIVTSTKEKEMIDKVLKSGIIV